MIEEGLPPAGAPVPPPAARRAVKRRFDEARQLDPWERYRVLTDTLKLQLDMLEMADRRTRFALLLLGTLNALNVIVVARPDLLAPAGLKPNPVPGLALYVVVYIAISVFLFVQAVVALKPRTAPLITTSGAHDKRLRHFGAMVAQTQEQYHDSWKQASVGEINKELAFHVQNSGRVAAEKYTALGRLYWGLMVLVVLTAVMLAGVVVAMMLDAPAA